MNENLRTSIWFVVLVVLSLWTAIGWLRYPPGERLKPPETPFSGTPGLDQGHWHFLQQAREVLPPNTWYTIRASSPGDEMALFKLAATVLVGHKGEPSNYYGVANPGGEATPAILSYRCEIVPPDSKVVTRLPDGCICERRRR
jgi:hypothetical protein